MATRARSRLYGNHPAIQATLLPLFELYSAESSFVKLDAAMDSLVEVSADLKTIQEQRALLRGRIQELEALPLLGTPSHSLNTAEVRDVAQELAEVAATVREEALRAESMMKTINPDAVTTIQELLDNLRGGRETIEERFGQLSQELDSIRSTDVCSETSVNVSYHRVNDLRHGPRKVSVAPGPHDDYAFACILLTLLLAPVLANKCLGA